MFVIEQLHKSCVCFIQYIERLWFNVTQRNYLSPFTDFLENENCNVLL